MSCWCLLADSSRRSVFGDTSAVAPYGIRLGTPVRRRLFVLVIINIVVA